jgi:hypothetical protein
MSEAKRPRLAGQRPPAPPAAACATLTALPDGVLRLVFDLLSAKRETLCVVLGGSDHAAHALASTCRRARDFYYNEYVRAIYLHATATAGKVARGLAAFPRAARVTINGAAGDLSAWQSFDFRVAFDVPGDPARSRDVTAVSLSNLPLFPGDVADIVEACPRLASLTVVGNVWYDAGDGVGTHVFNDKDVSCCARALVPHLRELRLEGAEIGEDGWAAVGAFVRLTSLTLTACQSVGFHISSRAAIAGLTDLRTLVLAKTKVTTAHLVACLPHMHALSNLDVSECSNLDHLALPSLPPSLTALKISNSPILRGAADDTFAHLARLTELRAQRTHMTTWRALAPVAPRLRVLDVESSPMSDVGVAAVLPTMTNLRSLNLASCPMLRDATVCALSSLPELRDLQLCGSHVSQDGINALTSGTLPQSLRWFYFHCMRSDAGPVHSKLRAVYGRRLSFARTGSAHLPDPL